MSESAGGRGGLEVGDGLAVVRVGAGGDLQGEDVARPAVLYHLADIPEPVRFGAELLDKRDVVVPGDLCKRLLHNRTVGPRRGEGAHVLEVARRETLHVGEGLAQVGR